MEASTTEVDCSGLRHRIVWNGSDFEFPDHDLEAEAALASLGGGIPPCLLVKNLAADLTSWHKPRRNELTFLSDESIPGMHSLEESLKRLGSSFVTSGGVRVDTSRLVTTLRQRLAIEQLPASIRALLVWKAAENAPARDSRSDDMLRADIANLFKALSPSEINVRCVLIEASHHPLVSGFIPHSGPGLATLWMRRTWSSGLRQHEGELVLGPRIARHSTTKLLSVRWEPCDGGLKAVARHLDPD